LGYNRGFHFFFFKLCVFVIIKQNKTMFTHKIGRKEKTQFGKKFYRWCRFFFKLKKKASTSL
jgi:hypothetical protein